MEDNQRYNLIVNGVPFRWNGACVRFELYGEHGEVVATIEPSDDWDGWDAYTFHEGEQQLAGWAPFPTEAAHRLMRELLRHEQLV